MLDSLDQAISESRDERQDRNRSFTDTAARRLKTHHSELEEQMGRSLRKSEALLLMIQRSRNYTGSVDLIETR